MPKNEQEKQDQQAEQKQMPPLGTDIPNSEFTKSPHTSDDQEREKE